MSGRFAGSKSQDERRRRRLAVDEAHQTGGKPPDSAAVERPLPERRPTGRFPLRRIVSRSHWKLGFVAVAAWLLCGAVVAAGYHPAIRDGVLGPAAPAFVSAETGRLVTACAGLLLLAGGQLAWLIRWARARSLRDFRGGYRIWWWTSFALVSASVALLTEAHVAFATTLVWLTGQPPFGTESSYRLLPALVAMIMLLPSLQRDMRGCRTSRSLVLTAAIFWLAAAASQLASGRLETALAEIALPTEALQSGLMLTAIAAAFAGLLFHARHVVYESVEPPDLPQRAKKDAVVEVADEAANETEAGTGKGTSRSRRAASTRKSSRTSAAKETTAEKEAAEQEAEPEVAVSSKVKETAKDKAREPAKPRSVPEPVAKPVTVPQAVQPAPAKPEPAPSRATAPQADEYDEEDASMVNVGNRRVRLDGPEDPMRGLSKRERRKMRKAMRESGYADED